MLHPSLLSTTLATLALLCPPATSLALTTRQNDFHWINTWTSMPQLVEQNNMPPSPYVTLPLPLPSPFHLHHTLTPSQSTPTVLRNSTLRQTLRLTLTTPKLKLAISNTFSTTPLPITAASIALPPTNKAGTNTIQTTSLVALTVAGKHSFIVPPGQVVLTDEIPLATEAQSIITVSLYSEAGQVGGSITGHPGSRTTSWFAGGNRVNAMDFEGEGTRSVHWYFVSAVRGYVPMGTGALVVLGDSITDGRGSDDDKNNRYVCFLHSPLNPTYSSPPSNTAGQTSSLTASNPPPKTSPHSQSTIKPQAATPSSQADSAPHS